MGTVTCVRMLDAAGEQAAQGQMASLGEAVVLDRMVTAQAHRRRGLGNFVMRTLADRALETGAVLGVLGATDAGRALYETLGWKKHATLAECVYQEHQPYSWHGMRRRRGRSPTPARGRGPAKDPGR
ncbi:GNAT family N-acetyltransferase [Streptomyces kronopolitis]|uniref:GNAT family N-acetyltransferase n=1 Tax=Streptomyces kronopolitis TaxID=1612435 RepID=UPI00341F00EF